MLGRELLGVREDIRACTIFEQAENPKIEFFFNFEMKMLFVNYIKRNLTMSYNQSEFKGRDKKKERVTILKDAFHIQPIGGARLVVGTSLEVVGELPRSRVVNHARVTLTDGVYNSNVKRALVNSSFLWSR